MTSTRCGRREVDFNPWVPAGIAAAVVPLSLLLLWLLRGDGDAGTDEWRRKER